MLTNIDAIIFDVDGTLLDSMSVWTDIDKIFIEKYNLKQPEFFHEKMEGKSYEETAAYFLEIFPELPHTQKELEKEWFLMAYEKYTKEIKMKDGAAEFIEAMAGKNLKLGIATSNHRELAEGALSFHNVKQYFQAFRTSGEVQAGKPSPLVYLKVAEELEVDPSRCLVFEDVPKGILAGKNAGMKVCAVYDAYSAHQEEEKRKLADFYIKDYYDIKKKTYEVL